jgi:putative protease
MIMKKPILLSPAGNYECFRGALLAGADAVYMGGDRFSARAYADNFTCENVCSAVTEAHFYGKRVYLTLNTLMKDNELSDAIEYIRPMYEAGLDAVIVQDLGAMAEIKRTYPDLEIHASTQMTISGEEGALWLKDKGIDCVVPSRELSIGEIKRMKEKTGMKLECFIHGAMCYCYSGQCLMSSMLGDRSGNRGRCAQPCRQMYETLIDGVDPERMRTTSYPLSMRDMCTIEILPELIEAGIDIFKIEGRMKSPEYCAGVTSIYRKYIDRYFENGPDGYFVDNEDMNILRHLYVRNQLQDGYYNRPNGADMISGDKPGYSGSDEKMIESIHKKYLEDQEKTVLSANVTLKTGSPA